MTVVYSFCCIVTFLIHTPVFASNFDDDDVSSRIVLQKPNNNLKSILRSKPEPDPEKEREKEETLKTLSAQQAQKRKEIMDFLKDKYLSTNYLYGEMKRIRQQRRVRDSLRIMVHYLEQPGREKLRRKVLKCYETMKPKFENPYSIYDRKPNNWIINVVKDPMNDGVYGA